MTPRITEAKMEKLSGKIEAEITRLQRLEAEISAYVFGNTRAADEHKLRKLRNARISVSDAATDLRIALHSIPNLKGT